MCVLGCDSSKKAERRVTWGVQVLRSPNLFKKTTHHRKLKKQSFLNVITLQTYTFFTTLTPRLHGRSKRFFRRLQNLNAPRMYQLFFCIRVSIPMQISKLPPIATTSFQLQPHIIILRCVVSAIRRGVVTQRRLVIIYRRFGKTYRYHLQGSNSQRRNYSCTAVRLSVTVNNCHSALRNITEERRTHVSKLSMPSNSCI